MKIFMKKKGFTLVELLAVIAILAILVIIALPNVMGMFNTAKKNSFTTEIKEIYKQAQQQWISDSMMSTGEIAYYRAGTVANCSTSNGEGQNCNKIDLTGRTQLNYFIIITKAGKITHYYVSDGSYQYAYVGAGLQVEDIGTGKIGDSTEQLAKDGSTNRLKVVSSGTTTITNNQVDQVSEMSGKELTVTSAGATLP